MLIDSNAVTVEYKLKCIQTFPKREVGIHTLMMFWVAWSLWSCRCFICRCLWQGVTCWFFRQNLACFRIFQATDTLVVSVSDFDVLVNGSVNSDECSFNTYRWLPSGLVISPWSSDLLITFHQFVDSSCEFLHLACIGFWIRSCISCISYSFLLFIGSSYGVL